MMLPNGWKKVKLGDLVSVASGRNKVRNDMGKYPVYGSTGIIGLCDDFQYSGDSILIARVGANAGFIHRANGQYDVSDNTLVVECGKEYDFAFAYQQLRGINLNQYVFGSGQPLVTGGLLKKIELSLPPLEEQKKIAATLSVWDSAIEKMEKLIEAKESQKKSLITKLIVFSDDKNISELTKIKLSDIFDEVCEKNRPDEDVLTIIQGVGTVLRTDSGREIIYDKNSLSNYKYVKKGDFIIHLRSFESGLEVANQDGIVSPAYIILRPKIKVSTVYLYSLFHTNEFINRTIAPAVEGARDGRSVKYDVLKKQTITLPNLSEQQSVARLLLKADEELSILKQQLENYNKQKQGLMQKLLTGQWRVK